MSNQLRENLKRGKPKNSNWSGKALPTIMLNLTAQAIPSKRLILNSQHHIRTYEVYQTTYSYAAPPPFQTAQSIETSRWMPGRRRGRWPGLLTDGRPLSATVRLGRFHFHCCPQSSPQGHGLWPLEPGREAGEDHQGSI